MVDIKYLKAEYKWLNSFLIGNLMLNLAQGANMHVIRVINI